MFKFLMSNRKQRECELEVKRAELKARTSHIKGIKYYLPTNQELFDFLGWGDLCNTCKEHDPYIHTHNFKHIKEASCVRCSSDNINQMSQIFGGILDPYRETFGISTNLFCTSCGHKFMHHHKFELKLIKEVKKVNESNYFY